MAEKKEAEKSYQLKEIPTQTGVVITDKDGAQLGQMEAMVEILNKLDEIKRAIS